MFNAFTKVDFNNIKASINDKVKREIDLLDDKYVTGVDETDFIEKFYEKHALDLIEIQWENVVYDVHDRDIALSYHPDVFVRNRIENRQTARRKCLLVYLPFIGNPDLLKYQSRIVFGQSIEINYTDSAVYFEVVCWDETDGGKYNQEIQDKLSIFKRRLEENHQDWESYNKSLKENILIWFLQRKERVVKTNTLLDKIEIPLRKRDNIPTAFALPTPPTRRKIPVELPKVSGDSKAEYSISEMYYSEILKTIYEVGSALEKYPSLYEGKNEEALRDYILTFLMQRFELDASAESFNKKGKTDILLKYKNENVFVAECKVWGGQKRLMDEDIPQLLRYLTWRDTKTAMVIFVREKGITDILNKIDVAVKAHNNFLRSLSKVNDGWKNYALHLDGDKEREVKMATIIYHLPN